MKAILAGDRRIRGFGALKKLLPTLRGLASRVSPRDEIVIVAAIGTKRMARLNERYKGRKGPAEILTFEYGRFPAEAREPLGEILLCWPLIERASRRLGVSEKAYASRLFVHGLLHISGLKHGTPRLERIMEQAEKRVLRSVLEKGAIEKLFD